MLMLVLVQPGMTEAITCASQPTGRFQAISSTRRVTRGGLQAWVTSSTQRAGRADTSRPSLPLHLHPSLGFMFPVNLSFISSRVHLRLGCCKSSPSISVPPSLLSFPLSLSSSKLIRPSLLSHLFGFPFCTENVLDTSLISPSANTSNGLYTHYM